MRSLLIFALMISTTCLAAGPDSQEFVGLSTIGNKLMKISYASDIPQEGIDNKWFYSSTINPRFRYCWKTFEGETEYFVCASKPGDKPTVSYRGGQYYREKHDSFSSEENRKLYNSAISQFRNAVKAGYDRKIDALLAYYRCDKDCDDTMPLFIFEVAFDD